MEGESSAYYFRSTFHFSGNPNDMVLQFTNELDDGAVFYINNVEVLRVGLNNGPVTFTTAASRSVGSAALEIVSIPGPTANLVSGINTIAVEVHQFNRFNNVAFADGTNVVLTTAARMEGQNYLLFARNLRDVSAASNAITANSAVPISWRLELIQSDDFWQYYRRRRFNGSGMAF